MKQQTITEEFTNDEVTFLYGLVYDIWANGSYGNGLHNGKVVDNKLIKPLYDKLFGMHYELTECRGD